MRLRGSKFDIRNIEEKDKKGFEKVMRQVAVFGSLFDAVPDGVDTFWKIYGESDKDDVFSIVDKNDEFLGLIHYELEDGEEQGQLEMSLMADFSFDGFGSELMPQFLEYAYKETGATSFLVELMNSEDPSRLVYEEMGYQFGEEGYIEICDSEVKEDHLNKVKELLKSMGINSDGM